MNKHLEICLISSLLGVLRFRATVRSIGRGEGSKPVTRGRIAENLYQIRLSGLKETAITKAKF